MADVAIRKSGVSAAPNDYQIPGAQEIVVRSVAAVMDGTSAGSAWFPCLEIVDPSGNVLVSCVPTSSVAAGASADVSWFPGVNAQGAAAASGVHWPGANQAQIIEDSTTWPNTIDGTGFYDALAMGNTGAGLVLAQQGWAYPTFIITGNASRTDDFFVFGDGSFDPDDANNNASIGLQEIHGAGTQGLKFKSYGGYFMLTGVDTNGFVLPSVPALGIQLSQGQPPAVGPLDMYAGHGVPTIGADNVGDLYWRQDGAAGSYLYRCTVAGNPATWTAIL